MTINNPQVLAIQQAVKDLGYDPGPLDGLFGSKTEKAVQAWLENRGKSAVWTLPKLPWITELKSVFGLHESRDKAKLAAWLKSDGRNLGDPEKLPWCGDAMETAIKNSLPLEPFPSALNENPYWALNWRIFGVPCRAGYGAVGVFDRPGPGAHVGILVGEDDIDFYVLGGNQGDSVSISRIDKGRLVACRWPMTRSDVPVPLPRMLPGMIPKSVNEF